MHVTFGSYTICTFTDCILADESTCELHIAIISLEYYRFPCIICSYIHGNLIM